MQIELLKDTSILSGYVGLDGNNIAMVKQVVVDEMNKLKTEDVDEQELTRVKNYIEGIMLIQFERTGSQNKFISDNLLNDTSVEIDDLFKQIESVTTQDIKNFANKYFNKENICFAQIIPK
jgi:predicted Zn-dependent peptidase